jgi:hypothetical protein
LKCFAANGVRFPIVGGYALAVHGAPRYTGDFDAWVRVSEENARAVLASLESFGFGSLGLTVADFECAGSVVQLGYPPTASTSSPQSMASTSTKRDDDGWNW